MKMDGELLHSDTMQVSRPNLGLRSLQYVMDAVSGRQWNESLDGCWRDVLTGR